MPRLANNETHQLSPPVKFWDKGIIPYMLNFHCNKFSCFYFSFFSSEKLKVLSDLQQNQDQQEQGQVDTESENNKQWPTNLRHITCNYSLTVLVTNLQLSHCRVQVAPPLMLSKGHCWDNRSFLSAELTQNNFNPRPNSDHDWMYQKIVQTLPCSRLPCCGWEEKRQYHLKRQSLASTTFVVQFLAGA